MSVLKFLKYSLSALLFTLFLASCDKASEGALEGESITSKANLLNNFSSNIEGGTVHQDTLDCFTLNYPIVIVYPDGSESSVSSDQELDDALDAWFQANENSEAYPTFKFPIQVTLSAGTIQDVNSEEELEDLIDNCYDYEDCEYLDDYDGEIEDLCFSFNYPISISFPDGTTQTVETDSTFENLIEQWFMTNGDNAEDPSLVYPVDITLEDATIQTINSDDEFDVVLDECFDDYYDDFDDDDYGDDYDDEYEGEFEDDCFTLVFPITVQLPDGSTMVADNEDGLDQIFDNFFDWVSDTTESYPMFVYPIEIVLSDNTTQTINSEEELESAFSMCYEDYEYTEDFEDLCFDIDYPVTILLPDNTSAEVNSDDEAEDILEKWYDDNGETAGDPTLSFPVTITKEDGSKETINSEEEFEEAIRSCFQG